MYQPQQPQNCDEEQRFLFGSKKFRCYGSIDDLNSPSISAPKMARIIVHKVQQSDTLQSLELRYNSSMFEIKRLNKLWSNQSLFCKSEVLIPIFEEASSSSASSTDFSSPSATHHQLNRLEHQQQRKEEGKQRENEESLDQLLKRIDMNMKRTKKAVKRLHQRTDNQQQDGE